MKNEGENYIPSPEMEGDKWYDLVCREELLGLKFNGVEVTTIVPGGWADRAGVELDDEITSVNDVEFGPLTRKQKIQALQEGRPVRLKFKRPVIKDVYFDVELDQKELGLGFTGVKVSFVVPGGWAEQTGIELDDEIAEVCGIGFSTLTNEEKLVLFKQPRPIVMKFKRPYRGNLLTHGSIEGTAVRSDAYNQMVKPKAVDEGGPRQNQYTLKKKEKSPRVKGLETPRVVARNSSSVTNTPRQLKSFTKFAEESYVERAELKFSPRPNNDPDNQSWWDMCCGGATVKREHEVRVR